MRTIYWLRNDLRLHDNPALLARTDGDALLCLYILPEQAPWCNLHGMGAHRERFLLESLQALHDDPAQYGQRLLVLRGAPELLIPQLVQRHGLEELLVTATPGVYEQRTLSHLQRTLGVPITEVGGNCLYRPDQLPGGLAKLPKQFTPFRRNVEALSITPARPRPDRLPPPLKGLPSIDALPPPVLPHPACPVRGGEREGLARLQRWLRKDGGVLTYKQTRNALEGLRNFSMLSPWLANGSLSVREVAVSLFEFEQRVERNESTQHLFMELLWREFFHWRAWIDADRLFQLNGISKRKKLLRTFDARDFARWCQGETDYPLVNALMHQLTTNGWMSNRGRQIAASCLINELGHDWRYGAAFFEKHLLDYDMASNYGNWQYIAGVGTDPRGGRHFNLEKQAAEYDPEGRFTAAWDGQRKQQPRYVTDAADWPVEIDE